MWQFAFAAFCAAAAPTVHFNVQPYPVVHVAGVTGYLLAVLVVGSCAMALSRPRTAVRARRALIIFHLVFVPLQFLFSFGGGPLPLLGMAFSSVLAVRMKPHFPQLKRRTRKLWLTVHVGVSVGWLGLSMAMTTLAVTGATSDSHPVRHGAYELMHIFDLTIVIPSVVVGIISGLVVSLGTPWGLVKHWWVLLKFVISLTVPVIATVQSTWIEELRARTEDPTGQPGDLGVTLALCMTLYAVLLWAAVVLSVFKPGGRTRWGRRKSAVSHSGAGARAGDTPVTVGEIRPAAERTILMELRPAQGGDLPPWQPGAHIDLVLPSGTVRQYTLCGDPDAVGSYRIAVLNASGGRGGSAEVHRLRPGTALAFRGPRNNFPLAEAPAHLFIAGGIGITPFLPMINLLASRGADWRLLYRGRSRQAMAFADELERRIRTG